MNLYMTSGTPDYMEKLVDKFAKEPLIILHGNGNSVLLHESDKKSIFAVPRKFEIIEGAGTLTQGAYYVMFNMPILSDDRPVFENKLTDQLTSLRQDSVAIAYRFLRPVKAETYILLTHWSGPASYELWKNSNAYKTALQPILDGAQSSMQTMFNAATYVTTYSAPLAE